MSAADDLTPIAPGRRWPWVVAVGVLLAGAFALRLWGVKQGLPYAYNLDEASHYVPRAIGMFGHSLDPHYYVNPPAYTYVVHAALAIAWGGRAGVAHQFLHDPQSVYVLARVIAAVLGTIAVGLLYLAGARLFDRRVALLAAAVFAVAYLPVFYAHQALNDTPTLAPLCLALWGTAGIVRFGRVRDCVWTGIGIGLTCATKYTGGIVALPALGAIVAHASAGRSVVGSRWWAWRAFGVMAAVAVMTFVIADPYAILQWHGFTGALHHQSQAADDALGKLGLTQHDGYTYYLWTFTWGLGWAPLVAAAGGAAALLAWDRRAALVLIPAPVAFVLFMGAQSRHFGRWLLPVFPIVCLLAAAGIVLAVDRFGEHWRPGVRRALYAAAAIALCVQGAIHSVHSDALLSRQDTRGQARAWLAANVAPGTKIVVEPIVPGSWLDDIGRASPLTPFGDRWQRFTRGALVGTGIAPPPVVAAENYERTLSPALLTGYERAGYCWIVSGSTQSGRAQVDPKVVPGAIGYYRALRRRGVVAARFSPYRRDANAVRFNFDWSFDSYPLAYDRPGPVVTIWHLTDGRCGSVD
jgi:4-amino-4-deoxy-L-arabinose transferase-like glycosyltransferase